MTEDHVAILTGNILSREKCSPQFRGCPKNVKKLCGNERAGQPNRLANASEVELMAFVIRCHVGGAYVLTHGHDSTLWIRSLDADELFRAWIRQGYEQNSIHQAEDGGVRADAQSQRERSNKRERPVFAQHAQAETQILHEAVGEVDATRVAAFLLGALDGAKLDARPPQRFLAGHAATHQILGVRLDVEAQLRVQLALHPRTIDDCGRPRPQLIPKAHAPSSGRRTERVSAAPFIRTSKRQWGRRAWRAGLAHSSLRAPRQ